MKKYLSSICCFLSLTCFGADQDITVNAGLAYGAVGTDGTIAEYINDLQNNDKLTLTITADPTMEKTWAILSGIVADGKTGITLELTAKDKALNKENLEYLAECLLYASNNVALTSLDISNNDLSVGNNTFYDYLSACTTLKVLTISKNKSNFCSTLLERLSTKKLENITASECGLRARNFEKALSLNTGITVMDLSQNNIDGLTDKFADYLNKQTNAFTLTLDGNAELFKNPRTVEQVLNGIGNANANTVSVKNTSCSTFVQAWLNAKKDGNTINF